MAVCVSNPRERKVLCKYLMSNIHNNGVHTYRKEGSGGEGGVRWRVNRGREKTEREVEMDRTSERGRVSESEFSH